MISFQNYLIQLDPSFQLVFFHSKDFFMHFLQYRCATLNFLFLFIRSVFIFPYFCSQIYLSHICIIYPAFFLLMLVSCFFFHLFTFNLVCSLYIKWVSFKQYRVGFYFLFNLKIFGLIGVFKSLIFNMLKYMVALKSTILLYLSVPHILCYFFLLFLTYFGLYFFMVSLYLICRLIGYNCFFVLFPQLLQGLQDIHI